jgi:hypothetical protein
MARSASADPIGEFNQKLVVLSRTNGAAPRPVPRAHDRVPQTTRPQYPPSPLGPPRSTTALRPPLAMRPDAFRRRRRVVLLLGVAVAVTIPLAVFTGAPAVWGLHFFADVCLLAFVGACAWARNAHIDRSQKVRELAPAPSPELALRRTGST